MQYNPHFAYRVYTPLSTVLTSVMLLGGKGGGQRGEGGGGEGIKTASSVNDLECLTVQKKLLKSVEVFEKRECLTKVFF